MAQDLTEPRCYGQRMLNPFHGVMNVVESEGADAVTRDGILWSLYVHGDRATELADDGLLCPVTTPDIKYGTWSVNEGLKRAPVRSTTDYAAVEQAGSRLLAAVKDSARRLPFPLEDCYELWLLNATTDKPLALLDSTCDPVSINRETTVRWSCGQRARSCFRASQQAMLDDPMQDDAGHGSAVEYLVNQSVGKANRSQWFKRNKSGGGSGLRGVNLESALVDRELSSRDFPELMLETQWQEPRHNVLINDFLRWQAPWLLSLQHITHATRHWLERAARCRAVLLAEQHRLYPIVIEREWLNGALIEAILRGSISEPKEVEATVLSPFYLEI